MLKNIVLYVLLFNSFITLFAQIKTDSIHKIKEVVIESQRVALPFQKQSHTINLLTANEINNVPVTTLDELLQYVAGVDIRRRGIKGMQSDLFIRGGNFNQVLLLTDGIAMNDLQTGHHIMNGMLALENIERIEIIKGAAARIYGQNAMNGAINIVTKKFKKDAVDVSLNASSFESFGASVGIQKKLKNVNLQFSLNKQQSVGYRFNTDFDNWNAFFKTSWNNYSFLLSYSKRDFGANGFYASPDYKDQYEETATHLAALSKSIDKGKIKMNLKTYWRKNEDRYLFLRQDPDFYQNLHTNNIIGLAVDTNFESTLGNTGIGIDLNEGFIESNNLGDHNRFSTTAFIEHRLQYLDNRLDITPGVAFSYFSDFKAFANPGLDLGYRFSKLIKFYGNLGYTSRIPTYTNLYYSSPVENGNPNLAPEKALTYELGLYLTPNNFHFNIAGFQRNTSNLIDWVKDSQEDKWQAQNIGEVITKGIETHSSYTFIFNNFTQKISLGYTYLDDRIKQPSVSFSRYSLNSFRNQLNTQLTTQLLPFLQQQISYRFNERTDGTNYQIVDVALNLSHKNWGLKLNANNIFGETYTETNLVPMPKANYLANLSYSF